jgi:hypothetical protein
MLQKSTDPNKIGTASVSGFSPETVIPNAVSVRWEAESGLTLDDSGSKPVNLKISAQADLPPADPRDA